MIAVSSVIILKIPRFNPTVLFVNNSHIYFSQNYWSTKVTVFGNHIKTSSLEAAVTATGTSYFSRITVNFYSSFVARWELFLYDLVVDATAEQ